MRYFVYLSLLIACFASAIGASLAGTWWGERSVEDPQFYFEHRVVRRYPLREFLHPSNYQTLCLMEDGFRLQGGILSIEEGSPLSRIPANERIAYEAIVECFDFAVWDGAEKTGWDDDIVTFSTPEHHAIVVSLPPQDQQRIEDLIAIWRQGLLLRIYDVEDFGNDQASITALMHDLEIAVGQTNWPALKPLDFTPRGILVLQTEDAHQTIETTLTAIRARRDQTLLSEPSN